ncbi:class I SAM-dependent RNA methyltransferase [Treponema sp.]
MLTAIALCAVGAEKALSNELRKLNLTVLFSGFGRVRFNCEVEGLYRALMALRTADRVLLETASFAAPDFEALFEGTRAVVWEDLVPRGLRIVVAKVRTSRSALSAETSIQAVVHKAAAERLCTAWGVNRLSEYGDAAELRVYIEKDVASILLDLSGEPLFRRGYRTEGGAAPLRETTAAAILLLLGWKRKLPLYDPFCGSGTFAIEAALYAWDASPGVSRSFAISQLALADTLIEKRVREELVAKVDFTRTIRIEGSDSDGRAVSIAKSNAERAYELAQGLKPGGGIRLPPSQAADSASRASIPRFSVIKMEHVRSRYEEGFLIANPPYGERLGDLADAERSYRDMAVLAESFSDWSMGVLTNHPGFESHFGFPATSVREITNGALRSYLYMYERLGRRNDVDRRRTR